MNKKRLRMMPDQLNYQDRGKMKWQGLLLSDHKEALKKTPNNAMKKHGSLSYPRQSILEISEQLATAYQNKYPLVIQTNTLNTDQELVYFFALVTGSEASDIYFTLKNNQLIVVPLENIRSVQALDILSWQFLN